LLPRYRRWFAALSFLLLAAPLAWGLVRPDNPDLILKEGHRLSAAPVAPGRLGDIASLPVQVDAYLSDRFGLRHAVINLHKDLTRPVFQRVNADVLVGRNGLANGLALAAPGTEEAISPGPMPDHVIVTGRSGPTILVIGDLFTTEFFPVMLSQHVGRAIWVHHYLCGFDGRLIERLQPDEIWLAPTEAFLICGAGVRPISFAG
jgi:hypothetical protein